MFSKWFSRKSKNPALGEPKPAAPGFRIREPKRPALDRLGGRPPLDSDRDFVYHEH